MMRFNLTFIQSNVIHLIFRHCSTFTRQNPIFKVLSEKDDEYIKFSFRYNNAHLLNMKARKTENVELILERIKLIAAIQRKKEVVRQAIIEKYSRVSAQVAVETEEDVDVCLFHDEKLLENIPNEKAWEIGSVLKIGDTLYQIKYNFPTVVTLTLPNSILAGCAIRPHFIFEHASVDDCEFIWYRSIPDNVNFDLSNELQANILDQDEKRWLKVSEGFIYFISPDDIGCKLRLVCIPKQGDKVGQQFITESKSVVEPCPEFPFEERHKYTKCFTDENSLRCVSYNILANVYVERKRFPYSSRKARDVYYRKQLLLKELLGYNSDIICLQEVQERVFDFDLLPVLHSVGYEGLYTRKGGRTYEGLATFYRSSKFRLLKNNAVILTEILKEKEIFNELFKKVSSNYKDMSKLLTQDSVFQTALLEDINCSGRQVLIANTHLYSNKDMPEVRLMQAALCACYAEHLLQMDNLTAILFCGDFNSLPHSAAYEFLISGNFECCPNWKTNSGVQNTDTTIRHNLSLESACGTPEYTNYTDEFFGCLDYIFYSKNDFIVEEIVPMPNHEKVIEHVALPSELFPSDHLALICTLRWKNLNKL